jgi:VanZ family protein
MAFIFALSSVSDVPGLPGGMSDKTGHALLYAGLGFLLVRALARGRLAMIGAGTAVLTILIAAGYGLSDETHQLFVPGRQFDLLDLAADGVGAGVAAGLGWAWGIIRRHSASL